MGDVEEQQESLPMSVYRFGEQSIISEIVMRRSAGGGRRAYLLTNKTLDADQVQQIHNTVTENGWQYVATEFEGRPALEIRGVGKIDKLESALSDGHFISGGYNVSTSDDTKYSTKEKLKANMLMLSGVLNVLADIGFIAYGQIKHQLKPEKQQWEDRAAGIAYFTGSSILALGGHGDKSDHHIREISIKLCEKFQQQGMTLPPDCAAQSFTIAPKRNMFGHIYNALQKRPAEIGNSITGTAGALIVLGAQKSEDKYTRITDSILGAATMTGGFGSAFVKEKAPDPKHPSSIGSWKWIQERPNRLAGYGYMVSSFAHGIETIRNMATAKSQYPNPKETKLAYLAYGLRGLFTIFNLAAEVAMVLASKGNGKGVKSDSSIDDTAFAIVADAIVRQPKEKQEHLITDLSHNFLANPEVLGGDAAAIEASLRERINKIEHNQWSNTQKTVAPEPETKTEASKPALTFNWQQKFNAQQAAPTLAHAI